jgi:hypothetical protein
MLLNRIDQGSGDIGAVPLRHHGDILVGNWTSFCWPCSPNGPLRGSVKAILIVSSA